MPFPPHHLTYWGEIYLIVLIFWRVAGRWRPVQKVLHTHWLLAILFQWYVLLIVFAIFIIACDVFYFGKFEVVKDHWLDPAYYQHHMKNSTIQAHTFKLQDLYIHPVLRVLTCGAPILAAISTILISCHAFVIIRAGVQKSSVLPYAGGLKTNGIRLTICLPLFYIAMTLNALNRTLQVFTAMPYRSVLFIAKKSLNLATLFQCIALFRFLLTIGHALISNDGKHAGAKSGTTDKYRCYLFKVLLPGWLYIVFSCVFFSASMYEGFLVIFESIDDPLDDTAKSQRVVLQIMKGLNNTNPSLVPPSEWWGENVMGHLKPLNGLFTMSCVINVMILCNHPRIRKTPYLGPQTAMKFNAVRMLVLLGAVQPLFIEKITKIGSTIVFIQPVLTNFFGEDDASEAQQFLIHATLLCWECFFIALLNIKSWDFRKVAIDESYWASARAQFKYLLKLNDSYLTAAQGTRFFVEDSSDGLDGKYVSAPDIKNEDESWCSESNKLVRDKYFLFDKQTSSGMRRSIVGVIRYSEGAWMLCTKDNDESCVYMNVTDDAWPPEGSWTHKMDGNESCTVSTAQSKIVHWHSGGFSKTDESHGELDAGRTILAGLKNCFKGLLPGNKRDSVSSDSLGSRLLSAKRSST